MTTSSGKIELKYTFKGIDSTDSIKAYADKRIAKIAKHLHKLIACEFVFMVEKGKQIAQLHVISGDFEARAESHEATLYASIDEVVEKMVHQTRKYKEKLTTHAGTGHHNVVAPVTDTSEEEVGFEDER